MNRSSKGFGLVGVLATVLFLVVTAVISSSANSMELPSNETPSISRN